MKDIIIDNNISKHISAPPNTAYKDFIAWLTNQGVLAISQHLLNEYKRGCCSNANGHTITAIIKHLTIKGRIYFVDKKKLNEVKFTRNQTRNFRSNRPDRDHIKLALCTHRRLFLTEDKNLTYDLNNLTKNCQAFDCPSKVDYESYQPL